MPRLFTALEIPNPIAMQLSLLQTGLPGARWIVRENFHITLKFIGDVELPVAKEIAYAMERVKTQPFSIKVEGMEVFGNSKPHSLYAGISKSQALLDLHAEQDRICRQLGIPVETRKFTPHITIARIRNCKTRDLAQYLSRVGGIQSQVFAIKHFKLLSSRDSIGGGPYVTEETYQLMEDQAYAQAG